MLAFLLWSLNLLTRIIYVKALSEAINSGLAFFRENINLKLLLTMLW